MRTNLMKQAGLVIATALVSGQAFAALNLDARFDNVSVNPNDKAKEAGFVVGSNAFKATRLKLDYQGKVSDELSFRFRMNGLYNAETAATRDSMSKLVDFAYLTHKMTDNQSLIMGKHQLAMGGWEGNGDNPGDVYYYSVAAKEAIAAFWQTGATLVNTYGDHTFNVSMANNTSEVTGTITPTNNPFSPSTVTTATNQTRKTAGVSYVGKFMDGALQPWIGYFTESYQASEAKKNYMSAGIRYAHSMFDLDFDYHSHAYSADGSNIGLTNTNSIAARLRYKLNDTMGLVAKVDSSSKTYDDTTDYKVAFTGMAFAFEYKPVKDSNFRYHAAYVMESAKPDTTGAETYAVNTVYVGARLLADFLK